VDGSDPDDYDVDDTGLAAANAAASAGDDILIPPYASFTSNYTITANVAFIGQSPYATKFTGQITLGAGSYIKDCGINRSVSSTGTAVGIVGPASGKGYVISCAVIVDQDGAGNAIGLDMAAGDVDSRESYFYGDAASGTGYGITGDGGECNLSAGCWVRGTTAVSDGSDINGINFDTYIKVLDNGGNLVELYPATDQGVTDALSAAGSGDVVRIPDAINITGGAWTVGAGIELRGFKRNSILTGNITNNGILSNCKVIGNLTNNATVIGCYLYNTSGNVYTAGATANSIIIYSEIESNGGGYAVNIPAAAGDNASVHFCRAFGTGTAGLFVDDAGAEIHTSRFKGEIGGIVNDCQFIANCYFIASPTGSDGLQHNSGTAIIYNSIFERETGASGDGLNLVSSGLTLTDCGWDSITGAGSITYGTGDRGIAQYGVCNGRLTLTSGTPVTTSDVKNAGTLYFTPYEGNLVGWYSGARWTVEPFTEISLDISGYTASKPYDIWLYDNAGTLTLEGLIWTNLTTRATALTTQDGIYVKTGATTRRYLGTIMITSSTGECEDSVIFRGVYNYQNRVDRILQINDATAHQYATAAYRYWNNDSTQKVGFVIGVVEDGVQINLRTSIKGTSAAGYMKVIWDNADEFDTLFYTANFSTSQMIYGVSGNDMTKLGYHTFDIHEYAAGNTVDFYRYMFSATYRG